MTLGQPLLGKKYVTWTKERKKSKTTTGNREPGGPIISLSHLKSYFSGELGAHAKFHDPRTTVREKYLTQKTKN